MRRLILLQGAGEWICPCWSRPFKCLPVCFFKASDLHVTHVQTRSPSINKVLELVTETSKQSPDSHSFVNAQASSAVTFRILIFRTYGMTWTISCTSFYERFKSHGVRSVQHVLQPTCRSAAWPSHHCPSLVMHNDVFWSVIYSTNCPMLRLHANPAAGVSLAFSQLYKSAGFRNLSSLNFSIIPVSQVKQIRTSDSLICSLYLIFRTYFVSTDLFCVWTHSNN